MRSAQPARQGAPELRTLLAGDPGRVFEILTQFEKYCEVADDRGARCLLDSVLDALSAILVETGGGLLPHIAEGGACADGDARFDTQVKLIAAMLALFRRVSSPDICRLCVMIAETFSRRVETGGLAAGPLQCPFLLRSRWGAPATFSSHARAVRTVHRAAVRFESPELYSVVIELSTALRNRLFAWGRDFRDEFRVFGLALPINPDRSAPRLRLQDVQFALDTNAFRQYRVVANKGLLSARLDEDNPRQPILRIQTIDVASTGNRSSPTCIRIELPVGYAIQATLSETIVKDAAGQVVRAFLPMRDIGDGTVECVPNLARPWVSIAPQRQEVVDSIVLSGISAASTIFQATRTSEGYDLLLWLIERATDYFGSVQEVERRLGWEFVSIQQPLSLARAS
jgi:hypothetical protein